MGWVPGRRVGRGLQVAWVSGSEGVGCVDDPHRTLLMSGCLGSRVRGNDGVDGGVTVWARE